MKTDKPVGQTKDTGFVFGVRKTFPVLIEKAWEFLFSEKGIHIWLGDIGPHHLEIRIPYKTKKGIEGKVTTLKPLSHIRLTWKKKEWEAYSILQIRVIKAKTGTTISFHQEKLSGSAQRAEMKLYWDNVMEKIASSLTSL